MLESMFSDRYSIKILDAIFTCNIHMQQQKKRNLQLYCGEPILFESSANIVGLKRYLSKFEE